MRLLLVSLSIMAAAAAGSALAQSSARGGSDACAEPQRMYQNAMEAGDAALLQARQAAGGQRGGSAGQTGPDSSLLPWQMAETYFARAQLALAELTARNCSLPK